MWIPSPSRTQGLSSLPARVGSTLKKKFWDSNELVSSTVGEIGPLGAPQLHPWTFTEIKLLAFTPDLPLCTSSLDASVHARDILATLYVNGKESTVQVIRETSHRTVRVQSVFPDQAFPSHPLQILTYLNHLIDVHRYMQVELYGFALERTATMRLPRPFIPVRDRIVLPCFRAVETTVSFLLSDKPVRETPGMGSSYMI